MVDAHTIPLKADLSPKVQAPIPPKQIQSFTCISTGSLMFLVSTSISSVVIPFSVTSQNSELRCYFRVQTLMDPQYWSGRFQKLTPSIKLQLKLSYTDSFNVQHILFPFVFFPIIRVHRQNVLAERCLPGSAYTLYPKGSFLVVCKAFIVCSFSSPAGQPPPQSRILIACPQLLPISMHLLAFYMALPNADDPWAPDPQWKCIPSNDIPRSWICFILEWISSSESMSSPNFPEKGVDSLSVEVSLIANLHNIFILGAKLFILWSSSMVSAVVSLMLLFLAQRISSGSLTGLEYTMSSGLRYLKASLISPLEAQSIPHPFLATVLMMQEAGLDFIAQQGVIHGNRFFHLFIFLTASASLKIRKLELSQCCLSTQLAIQFCCERVNSL